MMAGDNALFRLMGKTGFFSDRGINDERLRSAVKGKNLQRSMSPLEQMFDTLSFSDDLMKMEQQHGIYMGSINVSNLSKGYMSSVRPDDVLPLGNMQKAERRVDELTQLGVSPVVDSHNIGRKGLKTATSNDLKNARKGSFIRQGMATHSGISLDDMRTSSMHAGLGEGGGTFGATGLSFNLTSLQDKATLARIKQHAAKMGMSEDELAESLRRSNDLYLTAQQGEVFVGGAMNKGQRSSLARVMGTVGMDRMDIKSVQKSGSEFLMPNVGGTPVDSFASRIINAVKAADATVKGTDSEIYNRILSGEANDIIEGMDDSLLTVRKGEAIALEKIAGGEFREVKASKGGVIKAFGTLPVSDQSAEGYFMDIQKFDRLESGRAGAQEITAHNTYNLDLEKSIGRTRLIGTDLPVNMNPLYIQQFDVLREQGRFLSDVVNKVMLGDDYFKHVLQRNLNPTLKGGEGRLLGAYGKDLDKLLEGRVHTSAHRFNKVKQALSPILGDAVVEKIGKQLGSTGSIEDASTLLTQALDEAQLSTLKGGGGDELTQKAVLALGEYQEESIDAQVRFIRDNFPGKDPGESNQSYWNRGGSLTTNVAEDELRKALHVVTPEEIRKGSNIDIAYDPKTKTWTAGFFGMTHGAAKTINPLDISNHMGEAGV